MVVAVTGGLSIDRNLVSFWRCHAVQVRDVVEHGGCCCKLACTWKFGLFLVKLCCWDII